MDTENWRETAKRSNSGRWGTDDELGTLNRIDASAIIPGCQPCPAGVVFPLGNAIRW